MLYNALSIDFNVAWHIVLQKTALSWCVCFRLSLFIYTSVFSLTLMLLNIGVIQMPCHAMPAMAFPLTFKLFGTVVS